jgi:hypothetical protein
MLEYNVNKRLVDADDAIKVVPLYYSVQNCILGCTAAVLYFALGSLSLMIEAVRTSETSVDNHFTRQYIPEDNSEHHTRRRENLKSHSIILFRLFLFFGLSFRMSLLLFLQLIFQDCNILSVAMIACDLIHLCWKPETFAYINTTAHM